MALKVDISAGSTNPDGSNAKVSKTKANGEPGRVKWHAKDADYDVTLPASVFVAPTGKSLQFTVTKGQTTDPYSLKSNAPTGLASYTVVKKQKQAGLPGTGNPTIMVDP